MFRQLAGAVALWIAVAGGARAEGISWRPVAYPDLIAGSDLIVVGKIATMAETAHDDGWTTCATMQVAEVLKGQVPADGVKLDFPSRHPEAYNGSEVVPAPAEVTFEKDQEGIWFLKVDPADGHFTAAHPARFKPMPFLKRIKDEIAKVGVH